MLRIYCTVTASNTSSRPKKMARRKSAPARASPRTPSRPSRRGNDIWEQVFDEHYGATPPRQAGPPSLRSPIHFGNAPGRGSGTARPPRPHGPRTRSPPPPTTEAPPTRRTGLAAAPPARNLTSLFGPNQIYNPTMPSYSTAPLNPTTPYNPTAPFNAFLTSPEYLSAVRDYFAPLMPSETRADGPSHESAVPQADSRAAADGAEISPIRKIETRSMSRENVTSSPPNDPTSPDWTQPLPGERPASASHNDPTSPQNGPPSSKQSSPLDLEVHEELERQWHADRAAEARRTAASDHRLPPRSGVRFPGVPTAPPRLSPPAVAPRWPPYNPTAYSSFGGLPLQYRPVQPAVSTRPRSRGAPNVSDRERIANLEAQNQRLEDLCDVMRTDLSRVFDELEALRASRRSPSHGPTSNQDNNAGADDVADEDGHHVAPAGATYRPLDSVIVRRAPSVQEQDRADADEPPRRVTRSQARQNQGLQPETDTPPQTTPAKKRGRPGKAGIAKVSKPKRGPGRPRK